MFKQYLFFLFLFSTLISSSQQIDDDTATDYIRIEGDTIVKGSIGLNEVLLLPRRPFKNSEEIRKYLILKRKTIKVYPYSVCLLYTSPSPRDGLLSRMPSSA